MGSHLEALVLNDLLVWREFVSSKPAIFHYRSAGGEEIDLVVEQGRRILPVEIKSSRAVRVGDARALDAFCAERGLPVGVLLYDGDEILPLTSHTLVLPLTVALFGTP